MPHTMDELMARLMKRKPATTPRRVTDEEILAMLMEKAYTAIELAEILDYSEQRMHRILNRLLEQGKVARFRIGRKVYWVATKALEVRYDA